MNAWWTAFRVSITKPLETGHPRAHNVTGRRLPPAASPLLCLWSCCKTIFAESFRWGKHVYDVVIHSFGYVAILVVKIIAAVIALRLLWWIYQWVLREREIRRWDLEQQDRERQERISLLNEDTVGGETYLQGRDNQRLPYYRPQVYSSTASLVVHSSPRSQYDLQPFIQRATNQWNSAPSQSNLRHCWKKVIEGLLSPRHPPLVHCSEYLYLTELEDYSQLRHPLIDLLISKANQRGLVEISDKYFLPLQYTLMYSILILGMEILVH
jgi:hypothetical protein